MQSILLLNHNQFFNSSASCNGKPLFHLFGFLVCVGSTAGRALKSVVQGILLTSEVEKLHSMTVGSIP
ncbi:putative sugar phosphate/phosphate translocator [Senna tora]|uniref:Putative sugar phosphate/phosphate translocator n=1 Tax=Senna tora TaxID=362788 RepID=A0A834U455_9FABA|nr:putative sugar phosphate/phosphate translocator [Senna tora]